MTAAPSLHTLLHAALPWLSFRARALIDAMVLTRGSIGPSAGVATRLGLHNRFGLARLLWHEGLPSLSRLTGWIAVLSWTWDWEHGGVALGASATASGKDPAACYRLVRRVTKKDWTTVRVFGSDWVLKSLLEECCCRGEYVPKKKSGGVSPAALMRQARGLTRTSARPLC
jgi:hypothetical protein